MFLKHSNNNFFKSVFSVKNTVCLICRKCLVQQHYFFRVPRGLNIRSKLKINYNESKVKYNLKKKKIGTSPIII